MFSTSEIRSFCAVSSVNNRLGLHFSDIPVTHAKLSKGDNLSLSIRGIILDPPACVDLQSSKDKCKAILVRGGEG